MTSPEAPPAPEPSPVRALSETRPAPVTLQEDLIPGFERIDLEAVSPWGKTEPLARSGSNPAEASTASGHLSRSAVGRVEAHPAVGGATDLFAAPPRDTHARVADSNDVSSGAREAATRAEVPTGSQVADAREGATRPGASVGSQVPDARESAAHAGVPSGSPVADAREFATRAGVSSGSPVADARESATRAGAPSGSQVADARESAPRAGLPSGSQVADAREPAPRQSLPSGSPVAQARESAQRAGASIGSPAADARESATRSGASSTPLFAAVREAAARIASSARPDAPPAAGGTSSSGSRPLSPSAGPGGLASPPRAGDPSSRLAGASASGAAPAGDPRAYKPYPWRTQTDAADPAKARAVLTVAELTRQIKASLERGFSRVLVRGEITGYRGPNPRGHAYFSLKDADACIEVKVWASTVARLKFKLRDGLQMVVDGSVDVYEPAGKYSLIANKLEPAGEGALALAFQQLKEKLASEGLLGDRRIRAPRPLPFLPRRIGVVTSRTGAALQDFLRVLYQRYPKASVLVADARVQGEGAAPQIVSALRRLARTDVDVIVVTRGGGSVEDLWAFNEEIVARAIHASPIPVISAIGHEVDFTIADFVADVRAPTPTAAAQLVAPVLKDLEAQMATRAVRLRKAIERHVLESQTRLQRLQARLSDPRRLLGQKQLHLSEQSDRLLRAIRKTLRTEQDRQRNLTERLQRKRPQAELALRRQELTRQSTRLRKLLADRLRDERHRHGRLRDRLTRASPAQRVEKASGDLAKLDARLRAAMKAALSQKRSRWGQLNATLQAVSPLQVMARGYAVVRDADGHVVRGAADVKPGDLLAIQLAPRATEELSGCDELRVQVTEAKPGSA